MYRIRRDIYGVSPNRTYIIDFEVEEDGNLVFQINGKAYNDKSVKDIDRLKVLRESFIIYLDLLYSLRNTNLSNISVIDIKVDDQSTKRFEFYVKSCGFTGDCFIYWPKDAATIRNLNVKDLKSSKLFKRYAEPRHYEI